MKNNRLSPTVRGTIWEALLDSLACWLISAGVILAFDQLFRFRSTPLAIALHPLLIVAVLLIFYRRIWVLPLLAAAGLMLTAAVLSAGGLLGDALAFIRDLSIWWITLFPSRSPLNTPENIRLVQWLIHISITLVVYALLRLTHSAALLGGAAGLLFFVIVLNGFRDNLLAMTLIAAGILPLAARSFYPRVRAARALVPLTSRHGMQAAGAIVCAVLSATVFLLLPLDTTRWKWRPAADAAADLQSLLNLTGEAGDFRPITLRSVGLQPRADRLGGDIALDDYSLVLRVKTDTPTLMKGRVYDIYTGTGWEAAEEPSYRFGSEAFADEYRRTFSIGKPSTQAGAALWDSLVRSSNTEVTLVPRSSTLYGFGKPLSLSMLTSKNEPPLFNSRSELFVNVRLPVSTRYAFTSEWLDRNRAGVEELLAEALASQDPDYGAILQQYTQVPADLPASIGELARQVTGGLDSVYAMAEALERYLQANFTYTLTPGDVPRGRDFVDYFLETREGYCVYFASAMAMMARSLNIPARFVVGYGLEGQEGGSWIALAKNAHAWVECYFYGVGWLAFDPTAGSGYSAAAPHGWDTPGDNPVLDPPDNPAADPGGEEPVGVTSGGSATGAPETTATTQPTTTTTTAAPEASATAPPDVPEPEPGAPPWWIGILIALLAILLVLLWVLRRVQTFRDAFRHDKVCARLKTPEEQAAYYYRGILRQLRLLDHPPQAGETPTQFAERLKTLDTSGEPDLTPVFARIVAWRYAEEPLTPDQVAELAQAHTELEQAIRRRMNGWSYFFKRMIGPGRDV